MFQMYYIHVTTFASPVQNEQQEAERILELEFIHAMRRLLPQWYE